MPDVLTEHQFIGRKIRFEGHIWTTWAAFRMKGDIIAAATRPDPRGYEEPYRTWIHIGTMIPT